MPLLAPKKTWASPDLEASFFFFFFFIHTPQRSILAFSPPGKQSVSLPSAQSVSQLSVLLSLYSDDLAMITGSIPPAMWTAGWELHHYSHRRPSCKHLTPNQPHFQPPSPLVCRASQAPRKLHKSSGTLHLIIWSSVTFNWSYGHKWEICEFYEL